MPLMNKLDSIVHRILQYEIVPSKKKLSDKFKEGFYSELYLLLSSGVDIKNTLEIIIDEQSKSKHKELISSILKKIIAGSTLSEAFEESSYFSNYEYNSIKIGEEGGSLVHVTHELSLFYTNKRKHIKQILSSLSYPIFIMITAFIVVIFMLNVVVPMFMDIFSRFKGELPAITVFIIELSKIVSRNLIFFILIPFAFYIAFVLLRKNHNIRIFLTSTLLKIPLVGGILKAIFLERFCMAMNLLVSSKVPLLYALKLVKKMINFYYLEHIITLLEEDINKGESLYNSMKKWDIFDQRFLALIKMGEEVNKLDHSFFKLKNQYSEFLNQRLTMLGSFIEPVLIIFVGIIVAVILIAMYLPLFQVSSSIF
jgi:type IV pilus assembly protein PilC